MVQAERLDPVGIVDPDQLARLHPETRLLPDLALRAGYHFRPAVAPVPTQTSNLLDSAVHSISLGGGYFFGDRPDEMTEPATGPHIRGANGSIDVFVRVQHMKSRDVAREEAKSALRKAIQRLPAVYAQVVEMCDLRGQPVREVAKSLQRSPGAVSLLRHRAHQRLADLMGTASRYLSRDT